MPSFVCCEVLGKGSRWLFGVLFKERMGGEWAEDKEQPDLEWVRWWTVLRVLECWSRSSRGGQGGRNARR